ncbi:uncharacterized protein LOC108834582 [Raphanus sativus]|uniref:Uncharacterized protein LOC108834582 n=1 Tax=Raphanus sativus TaxID=3726 RepID=A0A6J0LVL0_RAPSA|nr:uncharacterized protein LOC108834582 [Raphanus sativus]
MSRVKLIGDMKEEIEQWFQLNNISSSEVTANTNLQHCESWSPVENGAIKCNVHANWINAHLHSGVAWIARDHYGNVTHHARDAIVHAPNHFIAELRCIIYAMTSLSDLGVTSVILSSDYTEVIEAIKSPLQWLRHRGLLQQVIQLKEKFQTITFEDEKVAANGIARDIARSVLRDGRFQSYLAMGGPSWLHDKIAREKHPSNI